MAAGLGYSEAGLGGLPAVWRPSTRRAQDEAILGPTAARRAARRRCQQACEAALRNLLAAAAAPGSWQDRERAARPALRLATAGARVPGSARRRRNAAWHAAVAPAAGFARACDAAISAAASGPRLGAPAPCTPPAAPRQVAPTTPTKLRKEALSWPEGWQALESAGKGLGDDDDGDETSEQPTAAPLLNASLGLGLRQEVAGEPPAAGRAFDGAHGVPAVKGLEVHPPAEDEEEVRKEAMESKEEGVGKMEGDALYKHFGLTLQVDAGQGPRQEGDNFGTMEGGASGKHFGLTVPSGDDCDHGYRQEGASCDNMEGDASDEYFGPPAAWAALVAERERGGRTSRPFLRRRAELASEAKAATQRLRTIFDAWWRVWPYVNDLCAYDDGFDGSFGAWVQRPFEPQMARPPPPPPPPLPRPPSSSARGEGRREYTADERQKRVELEAYFRGYFNRGRPDPGIVWR
ncbi:unnamed protein product [Prorocentrum cordatum]|uniref:Uncharacterized protein n=1 Tax=Prorocentrum cordatum TaxID=2364126 RepID=A0ABN9QH49_9DINO|nr:unnamed protein product [Polarella glacialis]